MLNSQCWLTVKEVNQKAVKKEKKTQLTINKQEVQMHFLLLIPMAIDLLGGELGLKLTVIYWPTSISSEYLGFPCSMAISTRRFRARLLGESLSTNGFELAMPTTFILF